jgi:hypothetical protein
VSDCRTSITPIGLMLAALATGPIGLVVAQPPAVHSGEVVPHDVRLIFDRGLQFLANTQAQDGTWDGGKPGPAMTDGLENAALADRSWASGGKQGPGVTALALLAFLASGEDANFGHYSGHVRKAIRSVITNQDAKTGYIGPSMYHHGFAMLALAEAYGAVDDRSLWSGEKAPRSVGQALELAVRRPMIHLNRSFDRRLISPRLCWEPGLPDETRRDGTATPHSRRRYAGRRHRLG